MYRHNYFSLTYVCCYTVLSFFLGYLYKVRPVDHFQTRGYQAISFIHNVLLITWFYFKGKIRDWKIFMTFWWVVYPWSLRIETLVLNLNSVLRWWTDHIYTRTHLLIEETRREKYRYFYHHQHWGWIFIYYL